MEEGEESGVLPGTVAVVTAHGRLKAQVPVPLFFGVRKDDLGEEGGRE